MESSGDEDSMPVREVEEENRDSVSRREGEKKNSGIKLEREPKSYCNSVFI